jgi:AcrR family transcriptional regulator
MDHAAGTPRRTQGLLGGRSEQIVRRVLDAALVELSRSGYGDFRMEAIASRAAVNKTTIYRRWPNRVALVTALVERMRIPLRENSLPDTGYIERDLLEAFERRLAIRRSAESRAWARLLNERHNAEVESIIGATVDERRGEWTTMVTRAIHRGELPPNTDAQLLLDVVRAIVDSRSPSRQQDKNWLTIAVQTVMAGARAGTLARGRSTRSNTKHRRASVLAAM